MTLVTAELAALELPDWLKDCLEHPHGTQEASTAGGEPILTSGGRTVSLDRALVARAFEFAYRLHAGQRRASGEPYIIHPVLVAGMLRELGSDSAMVAAGFLHDIIEDTDTTLEELEKLFGAPVRQLVEGVTKLSKFTFDSKEERQAENFRRMFLAMAQDIRVIVVKLADRLHNMRTLDFLPEHKQRRIARETMEIFAPLANRLGIWRFKWELEDLSFKYLDPEAYRNMQKLVSQKRAEREEFIDVVVKTLRREIERQHIQGEITGRPKHLWGIYQKMQRQQKEFHEIYDVSAIRIIVSEQEECYRALSIVHNKFRPIPGRFKDYIGLPKPNRYQSLHTAVVGPEGKPLEVQIRTLDMHRTAEYGIAAHWKYKEAGSVAVSSQEEKFTWLRQLLDWQNDLKDGGEYLETLREDLFYSEVYVFTPKGDVVELPRGATPVDFAYRIHTEVGNRCVGAKVNDRMVPLDSQLKNGDIVEILTSKSSHPSLDWINFVVTSSAKNRIRQWFKRAHRDQNIDQGREMLARELGKSNLENLLRSDRVLKIAQRLNYSSVEDMLAALGYGEVTLASVLNKLPENTPSAAEAIELPQQKTAGVPAPSDKPILGIEGMPYHLARCCNPLPGEPIIGVVTRVNRSITIHHHGCPNATKVDPDQLIPVAWNRSYSQPGRPHTYPVEIQVEVIDRIGMLKDLLDRLASERINVRDARVSTYPNSTAIVDLKIDITGKQQLDQVTAQMGKMADVLTVRCRHRHRE
ncbi:RelA/SpoT family protein [Gloeobacter kilaueensis]|uniref:(P)ppGpp synthetase I, SpoT/RelA n=1 Tax=Gloeobacter kilaueensis (strain ATCC BAA-2537 / CCAP 1431/1 / ULC 316 / JS1) TaxID=1183438 RepID=U5QD84_GLOK1|nr:bifunctional (p)ppGpp synthetase/guanosine-3',5'-bis(diphosphate) 3'-pyrophosphohydrolase [Gloeobacter kilaueensis]AGY56826.1 (p)ppGpp synthetase I, SpoT/RelA [Gloeobacter kilaueensis JS1]